MSTLKVLTFNIWNRQGPWPERLPLLQREIAALAPDIVGLQEVLRLDGEPRHQGHEVGGDAGYHIAFGTALQIGHGLHFGNAILSRFPIARADNFALPNESGEESRAVLFAELDTPFGRVPVFNTHLDWKFHQGWLRERQVLFIADKVRELAPTEGFPPILMGDFNAEPDADEIRYLRGLTSRLGRSAYFADCFALAGDGPGHTYARSNPYAEKLREPNRRIDYIFVRGPDKHLRGEPLTARVVGDRGESGVFPSDHYGVLAEIQAAPRPQ